VVLVKAKTAARIICGAAILLFGASSTTARADDKPTTEIRAFRAQADTYVSSAQARRNYGDLEVLRADSSPAMRIYLRFRVNGVKGKVTGVALLVRARAGARRTFQVRRVRDDDWRERELTYENAPPVSLRYASSKPLRRGTWIAVDVTAFIADDDDVCLAITTRSPLGVAFASRESGRGPQLVFRTERHPKGSAGP
jgi:hypothetical protein